MASIYETNEAKRQKIRDKGKSKRTYGMDGYNSGWRIEEKETGTKKSNTKVTYDTLGDGVRKQRRTVYKKSSNENNKPKVKSHREIYKRDGKYYTTHKVGKLGGKEREISEKKYNRLSKKMDRRQKRF